MSHGFETRTYPEMLAGGFSRVDGTIQFYTRVNALLSENMVAMDFGSGRGGWYTDEKLPYRRSLRNLKGKVRRVIGVDVDPAVSENPSIDEAVVFDGSHIPLTDASVDIIIADHVFEHLPDPANTAAELDRILAPGGWICVRTPNKFGYVALVNQLLPENAKSAILHFAQPGRKDKDVFEAHYRLNTRSALRRHFSGYEIALHSWEAEPAYHAGKAAIFHLVRAWSSLVPSGMSTALFAFMRKSQVGTPTAWSS
ncbi:class I SAM-dependent methyltransferase [Mesorhizobium sp.]|uniref:class I SAM-dependent methyltransferase n=2 Tax=Mesorhizobium sp. TaxID=1871066 RepID=UPI000FE4B747|nr:class I SAM-dependent methyltransferase [Mesorhizobium sp.]RWP97519.1 MAG: class I SAM-dependent methyltransferase [Mesorhizobium sp.]